MKRIIPIFALLLTALLPSCTADVNDPEPAVATEAKLVETDISVIYPDVVTVSGRAVMDETTINPDSVVIFAFRNDTLRWALPRNVKDSVTNVIYHIRQGVVRLMEYESEEPLTLLMVANVDVSDLSDLPTSGSTKADVIDAINHKWPIDATEYEDGDLMPMAGEMTLSEYYEGVTATIPLTHVLAKVTLDVTCANFDLEEVKLINFPDISHLYNADTSTPDVCGDATFLTQDDAKCYTYTVPEAEVGNVLSATLFVPECPNTDALEEEYKEPMMVVKLRHRVYDEHGTLVDTAHYYYKMAFYKAPENMKIDVLRHNKYAFRIIGLSYVGKDSYDEAVNSIAYNKVETNADIGNAFLSVNTEIVSLTAAYGEGADHTPEFVGVSATDFNVSKTLGVARVTVYTNVLSMRFTSLGATEYYFSHTGDDIETITEHYYIIEKDGTYTYHEYEAHLFTLWTWMDSDEPLVGEQYDFYLDCSHVRKKMTITVTE